MTRTEATETLWNMTDDIAMVFRHLREGRTTVTSAARSFERREVMAKELLAESTNKVERETLQEVVVMLQEAAVRVKNGWLG